MKPFDSRPPEVAATEPFLRTLPATEGGALFAEPWQAQAFALTLALAEAGIFSWAEWATRLGAARRASTAAGTADEAGGYWRDWLTALEGLVAEKGVAMGTELATLKQAWAEAYATTPHGQPVVLKRG